MQVYCGSSQLEDGQQAFLEAVREWPQSSPQLILIFHSSKQNPEQVVAAASKLYPESKIAGCTSSGEHINGKHLTGSLVVAGLWTPDIKWTVKILDNIDTLNREKAAETVNEILNQNQLEVSDLSPDRHFCLTFIDGLSLAEELVSSLIAEALEGIPVLGGSAGDDLKFEKTYVIANQEVALNAATLVFAESNHPFEIIKHQHYIRGDKKLAVTKVDVKNRRVYELDGKPAKQAYAEALGVSPDKLTDDQTFLNPLIFRANNDLYIRSIQRIESDDSIIFYCGVEEGMVLEIGNHEEMVKTLKSDLSKYDKGEFFLACNCILRSLESIKNQQHQQLEEILEQLGECVIGFDTYGEQLNGLHINQTLVGLLLGKVA